MNVKKLQIIGIDFDGTLVEHIYPNIGEVVPQAFETLKWLQKNEVKLILITMRGGKELEDAIKFCEKNGIEFYAANTNPTQKHWTSSQKIYAEKYVDDSSIGCPLIIPEKGLPYVDWVKVKEILKPMVEIEGE